MFLKIGKRSNLSISLILFDRTPANTKYLGDEKSLGLTQNDPRNQFFA
jgi:hypothetical protein